MMKSVIFLVLLVAAFGVVMARSDDIDLPLRSTDTIEAHKEVYEKEPCCNECGECDRRAPDFARCECYDLVPQCHPSCRKCVRSTAFIHPPRYRCLDMSFKACHRNCNVQSSTAA